MNDCEKIILDELKDIKTDVKNLLLDVNSLKLKSTIWGLVGGALFTLVIAILPKLIGFL